MGFTLAWLLLLWPKGRLDSSFPFWWVSSFSLLKKITNKSSGWNCCPESLYWWQLSWLGMFRPCSRVEGLCWGKPSQAYRWGLRERWTHPRPSITISILSQQPFAVDLLFARSHCARPFQIDDGEEKRFLFFWYGLRSSSVFFLYPNQKGISTSYPSFRRIPNGRKVLGWFHLASSRSVLAQMDYFPSFRNRWVLFDSRGCTSIRGVIKFPSYLPYILPVAIMSAGAA